MQKFQLNLYYKVTDCVNFTEFYAKYGKNTLYQIHGKKYMHHSVEKREILSRQEIFRQINSLVTYLVK